MPHFRIETNVLKSKIPKDFVTKALPVLAKALGKPEQVLIIVNNYNFLQYFIVIIVIISLSWPSPVL